MPRTRALVPFLLLIRLIVATPAFAQALPEDFQRSPCLTFVLLKNSETRSELDQLPVADVDLGWTTSSFWISRDELVLADNAWNRLAKVSLDPRSTTAGLIEVLPAVDSGDGSYYLKYVYPLRDRAGFVMFAYHHDARVGNLVEVSPELQVRRTLRLESLGERSLTVTMLYRFAPLGDGILGYADLMETQPSGEVRHFHSYLLVSFDGSFKLLGEEVSGRSDLHDRSVRDFPFITSTSDAGYVLVLEDDAWIARVTRAEPALVRLGADPALAKYSRLPEIYRFSDPQAVVKNQQVPPRRLAMNRLYRFYRDVERSTMLAGLYAWDERLFLLAREAAPDGKTDWWLLEIDAETGVLEHQHRLPTRAVNVLLAPGDDFLAIVEKGATTRTTGMDFPLGQLTRQALSVQRVRKAPLLTQGASADEMPCQHVP